MTDVLDLRLSDRSSSLTTSLSWPILS